MKSPNQRRTPFADVLNQLDRKYSSFDGSGYQEPYYDYIEGAPTENTQTSSTGTKLYQADPYQVIIHNTSKTDAATAIIFGHDKFLLKSNFGSDATIQITMGQPGVDYVELLQASANPFCTQFIRVESENQLQISKFVTIHQKNVNGNSSQRSLNMQQFKSAYQNQVNMLDAPVNEEINGSTYWEILIEPDTTVLYTIFPLYKIDTSEPLKGNEAIKAYSPARVNTGGLVLPQAQTLPLRSSK